MSSPPLPSNVGNIDLESVLNVRRRTLASIGETSSPRQLYRYTDTIYLKREDDSKSLLSINSKIVIFGELQFLCGIFERYTSNLAVYEESIEPRSQKTSFSTTFEENENIDEDATDVPGIVSRTHQISISSQSSSPPQTTYSPPRRKKLNSIGRSQTLTSSASEHSAQNLEGKRYGCIQISNMGIIEILEILLRTGLELVNETSDYDSENVLHQNFVFSKVRSTAQRSAQSSYPRSPSLVGT